MTAFPTVPAIGASAGTTVSATAQWDALNRLFTATLPNLTEQYRCDPMGRRIAKYQLNAGLIENGRRYIYDGWTVCEERTFNATATEANAPSTLERVYVNGRTIDEPLLAMIDGNGDGALLTNKNQESGTDFDYYYLCNRMGSVMALLDADNDRRVLEYTRYEVYGAVTVLPIVDNGTAPGSNAADGLEDTPLDLTDNNQAVIDARTGAGGSPADPAAGRSSTFGNLYTFTARRQDPTTGLLYYRHRYYESSQGRFLTRDPQHSADSMNCYSFGNSSPATWSDPLGLQPAPAAPPAAPPVAPQPPTST